MSVDTRACAAVAETESILSGWNEMETMAAAEVILPCNGSRAWADGVVRLRPFVNSEDLLRASEYVWRALSENDWQQAFDSHPRLGETTAKAAGATSLSWSAQEQSAADPDPFVREELAKANRAYEAKFGRIFLLCATGRSAEEMLAMLRQRMAKDAATELLEAVEQQRLITELRLRRWLQMPALTCAELAAQKRSEEA